MAVVALVPCLYSLIYLSSIRDPAAHSHELKVGLVNLDQGLVYRDQQVNVGQELSDLLKSQARFDSQVMNDEAAARAQVKQGALGLQATIENGKKLETGTLQLKDRVSGLTQGVGQMSAASRALVRQFPEDAKLEALSQGSPEGLNDSVRSRFEMEASVGKYGMGFMSCLRPFVLAAGLGHRLVGSGGHHALGPLALCFGAPAASTTRFMNGCNAAGLQGCNAANNTALKRSAAS